MKNFKNKHTLVMLAGFLAGLVLLLAGLHMAFLGNPQATYYNAGIAAYKAGDVKTAAQLFDKSVSAYKQAQHRSWIERFIMPLPDRELAALADFQKGKTALIMKQGEACVQAWEESLALNPGNGPSYDALSEHDSQRMHEEALTVKYDLELLFKNNPQLAQQQGKGKPGQGQGQGKQQVPGTEPGKQPGKGNRDQI